jgi:hypothetical protein
MRVLFVSVLLACACPSKQGRAPNGGGSGGGGSATCDSIRGKVEALYRAEAEATEPERVAEAVADNTTMVMNDCARAPARVTACVGRVGSVAELEKTCLIPLDDEGTEGEALHP